MPVIELVQVSIPRKTGGAVRVPRYEVPLLKRLWSSRATGEDGEVLVSPINPALGDDRFRTIGSAKEEYDNLFVRYARHRNGQTAIDRVWANAADFAEDYDATVERDGRDVTPAQTIMTVTEQATPLEERKPDLAALEAINGVGADLAAALFDAGINTARMVAAASLEDLEAIDGIGPASAKRIQASATDIAAGELAALQESTQDTESSTNEE